tara:strand:- start:13643 stop:13924 length:282 start_codon:yes stop_codon:yes gene_type:complete
MPSTRSARGFLTGCFTRENRPQNDCRSGVHQPRYGDEACESNLALVDEVKAIADAHKATPSQVALAWVLDRGDHVVSSDWLSRSRVRAIRKWA